ncbi:hypothetical protein GHT06_006584 [Daphnia sinensis]|uniref:Uncharacterized protein n=1 Tax=Daphnia sinensis TaxID=1820382 RepID=A0AAD5KV29_9CRUS|nr:hypothetical protein GHT06_006584 [Daphnia sinensis]
MSSSQRLASVGGKYTQKLYFDPRADQSSTGGYWITDKKLRQKLSNLIDKDEVIQDAYVYSNPLSKRQWTNGKLYHAFVIIQTMNWWWSMEKNMERITIQRSKDIESVRDMYQRKKRTTGRSPWTWIRKIKTTQGRNTTINELINYIWRKDVLNKDYHVLYANCQKFAALLFDRIKSFEEQVYFDEAADESPSRSTGFYMTVDKAFEEVKRCGGSESFTKQEDYKFRVPFIRHVYNYCRFHTQLDFIFEMCFCGFLMSFITFCRGYYSVAIFTFTCIFLWMLPDLLLSVFDYCFDGGKYHLVMIFEQQGTFWSLEQLNTTLVIHRTKDKDVLLNECQRHPRRTSLKSSKMVEGLHWKNMNEAMEYFCKIQKNKVDVFPSLKDNNVIFLLYKKCKRKNTA